MPSPRQLPEEGIYNVFQFLCTFSIITNLPVSFFISDDYWTVSYRNNYWSFRLLLGFKTQLNFTLMGPSTKAAYPAIMLAGMLPLAWARTNMIFSVCRGQMPRTGVGGLSQSQGHILLCTATHKTFPAYKVFPDTLPSSHLTQETFSHDPGTPRDSEIAPTKPRMENTIFPLNVWITIKYSNPVGPGLVLMDKLNYAFLYHILMLTTQVLTL